MCGIFFTLSRTRVVQPDADTAHYLKCRGPDSLESHQIVYTSGHRAGQGKVPAGAASIGSPGADPNANSTDGTFYLNFVSSVLSLRGSAIQPQPLVDADTGSVLCWNGEAWKRDAEEEIEGNDTTVIFDLLLERCRNALSDSDSHPRDRERVDADSFKTTTTTDPESIQTSVADLLTHILGPYAFIFYDGLTSTLYFGRDRLGRRSLLIDESGKRDGGFEIRICSFTATSTTASVAAVVPTDSTTTELTNNAVARGTTTNAAKEISTEGIHCIALQRHASKIEILNWSTRRPPICQSLPSPVPGRTESFSSLPSTQALSGLKKSLGDAIRLRVQDVPSYTSVSNQRPRSKPSSPLDHDLAQPSKIAVLFSGGLDCTLLARMAHEILPPQEPIDLLNVAFENPRVVKAADGKGRGCDTNGVGGLTAYESCPDRRTGRSSLSELIRICPGRLWRFVAINVSYEEFGQHRPTIVHLMRPHNTEMDLSITMALYFAARGKGTDTCPPPRTPTDQWVTWDVAYTTTARVLLSGLGADELFGGYARHAAAFARGGYSCLVDELELDFQRIGTRNLGRDDRVVSHWGREIRYPFLDEDFVAYALGLPAWEKCGYRLDKPVPKHFETTSQADVKEMQDLDPAKLALRCLVWEMGMPGVACEKKRAIQFGARTAKMHTRSSKGTDIII